MSIFRHLLVVLREVPNALAARLDRAVLRMHAPLNIGGKPMCLNHLWSKPVPWPCADARRALDRIDSRTSI